MATSCSRSNRSECRRHALESAPDDGAWRANASVTARNQDRLAVASFSRRTRPPPETMHRRCARRNSTIAFPAPAAVGRGDIGANGEWGGVVASASASPNYRPQTEVATNSLAMFADLRETELVQVPAPSRWHALVRILANGGTLSRGTQSRSPFRHTRSRASPAAAVDEVTVCAGVRHRVVPGSAPRASDSVALRASANWYAS